MFNADAFEDVRKRGKQYTHSYSDQAMTLEMLLFPKGQLQTLVGSASRVDSQRGPQSET